MHSLPQRWRHRLLAAHVAAGAGALGAGVALLVWSGGLAGTGAAVTAVAAHLALLAAVAGLVAFRRHWRGRSRGIHQTDADRTPRHRTDAGR